MNSHPNHQSNLDDSPQQNNRRRLAFIDHLPTFRQYVQDTWLDLLVVICVGALALGLNSADNASTRQFPIIFREDGDVVYPTFSYPRRKSMCVQLVIQNGVSLTFGCQHSYLARCTPSHINTYAFLYYRSDTSSYIGYCLSCGHPTKETKICSPDANKAHLRDATKSFPSGHTTAAAADSHHWYDVIAGAIIGTIGALSAFRMSYASIWDYRFNHIPLPRPKSAWSPFGTHDGYASGSAINTEPKTTTPENFSYATGVPTFPSFAHPREWCPAGAPGDAWSRNELINADANFQRQAHYGA
ncbi:PAP2 domain-containing protein [Rhizoctonia solani AG-1 IA]|uniref:PAP2 domain-containing protein n=1 Tax=Thanatephorus cucumeris (strain AG1-IA) TaxID=983506 RepID=L8X5P7_THACA|nr:PAP2 domain-containing protein [Rhizoctonia solani AG-1 IA]